MFGRRKSKGSQSARVSIPVEAVPSAGVPVPVEIISAGEMQAKVIRAVEPQPDGHFVHSPRLPWYACRCGSPTVPVNAGCRVCPACDLVEPAATAV